MADLFWEPEAWRTYEGLAEQSGRLQDAVEDVLDRLVDDPTQAAVRPLGLRTPGGRRLWRVAIRRSVDDWSLVWLPHPTRPADVLIVYLGPATYALG